MGFFRRLGHAIRHVANAIAQAVSSVANAVGDAISDFVETIGNGIQRLLNLAADKIHIRFLSGILRWLGNAIGATFSYFASIIKAVFNAFGDIIAAGFRLLGGLITFNWNEIKEAFKDMYKSFVGALIIIFGAVVNLIQSFYYLEDFGRFLNDTEKTILKDIFKSSIATFNIKIVENRAGLFRALTDAPFTDGNTIYFKGKLFTTNTAGVNIEDLGLFVHESTHVWQYQNIGSRYTMDALTAQEKYGNPGAYDWENFLNNGVTEWKDLNKESQAEFLQDLFNKGEDFGVIIVGMVYFLKLLAAYFFHKVEQVMIERSLQLLH